MKKILITGGSGFIGTGLKQKLKDSGFILLTIGRGRNEDVVLELSSPELKNVISDFIPDIICHFASGTNITRAEEDRDKEFQDTVIATENLLNSVKGLGYKLQLIYLSSQAVYGLPQYLPIDEKHPLNPNTNYGKNKLKIEELIVNSGIDFLIFRVSSVFGKDQNYMKSGVVAKFINKMKENKSPVVFNGFDLICDFIYVNDLIEAIYKAICTPLKGSEIINLGSGEPVVLQEVLDILYKYFPNAPKPILESNSLYVDKEHRGIYLDVKKAKSLLNWKCNYTLGSGLKEMLEDLCKAF